MNNSEYIEAVWEDSVKKYNIPLFKKEQYLAFLAAIILDAKSNSASRLWEEIALQTFLKQNTYGEIKQESVEQPEENKNNENIPNTL